MPSEGQMPEPPRRMCSLSVVGLGGSSPSLITVDEVDEVFVSSLTNRSSPWFANSLIPPEGRMKNKKFFVRKQINRGTI